MCFDLKRIECFCLWPWFGAKHRLSTLANLPAVALVRTLEEKEGCLRTLCRLVFKDAWIKTSGVILSQRQFEAMYMHDYMFIFPTELQLVSSSWVTTLSSYPSYAL